MSKELTLTPLKAQVSKLENQAAAVVIKSPEDYSLAIDLVSKLKDTGNTITEKKESITKPLNESLRNIRSLFAPIEEQFRNAEALIKGKILSYKKAQDAITAAKESKIAARVEAGTMKVETAEKKIEQIQRIDNTTHGEVGAVQIRKTKKVRIVNPELLPKEYLIPNESLIRKDALSGKQIPGVEVYFEESVASYGSSTRDYADQLNPSQKK